jgi:SAM-dependent methyltransferase
MALRIGDDRVSLAVPGCRAAYDAHATGYGRQLDPTLVEVVERVAELAVPEPGARVLDLACGTGTIAKAVARRGASVVGVDASTSMLTVARERSPELEFEIADAHSLPFADGEFDAVACGLALSHFHRPLAALRETLRILRQGGRLVASAWGSGGHTATLAAVDELLERHGAPDKGYTLDEETWQDPERGSELLHHAGFPEVSVKTESFTGRFDDPQQALGWSLAWPSRAARLAQLDPKEQEAFLAETRCAFAETDLSWSFVFNIYLASKAAAGQ